jgi:hypothetical protein
MLYQFSRFAHSQLWSGKFVFVAKFYILATVDLQYLLWCENLFIFSLRVVVARQPIVSAKFFDGGKKCVKLSFSACASFTISRALWTIRHELASRIHDAHTLAGRIQNTSHYCVTDTIFKGVQLQILTNFVNPFTSRAVPHKKNLSLLTYKRILGTLTLCPRP